MNQHCQDKKPTWTCRVMETLTGREDFMTAAQLRAALGCNINQMSAALIHLRRRQAIDCVVEPNGVAWWFATPETDDRSKHVDERVPEEKGSRKPRRASSVIVLKNPVTGATQKIKYKLKEA